MPYRDTLLTCNKCGRQFVFTIEEQRKQAEMGLDIIPPELCPPCRTRSGLGPGPHQGVIKWYSDEKGYGFIIHPDGEEIFFHRTGIAVGVPPFFPDGTRVTYFIEQTEKGPQAIEVAPLGGGEDRPA